jgi:hypothetical protein
MTKFNKLQRAKCQGCKALKMEKDEKGDQTLSCKLGHAISFSKVNKQAIQPRPKEACYKPTTQGNLRKVRKMMKDNG